MFIDIHAKNPQARKIAEVVRKIENGDVIISPTDSVYAFCCAWDNKEAIRRIYQLKEIDEKSHPFSLLVQDIRQLAKYVRALSNDTFKFIKANEKKNITFILEADKVISRKFAKGRKTIGIRIVSHPILKHLLEDYGQALISSSIKMPSDEFNPYEVDPYVIYEKYQYNVPLVIDGGIGSVQHSTIIDCTVKPFEVLREGSAEISFF